MTQPEQGGFRAASQEQLTLLYAVGSIACIRHGEWFDPRLPEIVREPDAPYPNGPFFEISRTIQDIQVDAWRTGRDNLYDLARKWHVGRLTVQYMSDHRRLHDILPLVEEIPGSVSILVEERKDNEEDGQVLLYEEDFLLENRLVDGKWHKMSDRLNNKSPIDLFQDRHTAFGVNETTDLTYLVGHVGRIPRVIE